MSHPHVGCRNGDGRPGGPDSEHPRIRLRGCLARCTHRGLLSSTIFVTVTNSVDGQQWVRRIVISWARRNDACGGVTAGEGRSEAVDSAAEPGRYRLLQFVPQMPCRAMFARPR